jgi:aryl-alcohol dehydrogenase-like predicted oxidoreductase
MNSSVMDRRDFLRTSAGVTGAMAVSPLACSHPADTPSAQSGEWRNRVSGMPYRRLGRTNMMISRIVMGGDGIGPGENDNVRLAMDMGVSYGDTAPQYMNPDSEAGYGELFQSSSVRENYFINTKVSTFEDNRKKLLKNIYESLPASEKQRFDQRALEILEERELLAQDYLGRYGPWQEPGAKTTALITAVAETYEHKIDRRKEYYQHIIDSIENSLRKMNTDYVDQMMCPHGADTPEEVNIPEIFEAFEKLRKDGKVRFLGVSTHTDPAGVLRAVTKNGMYDTVQAAYNVNNMHRVGPAIKQAYEADIGIIAMKAGKLFSSRQNPDWPTSEMMQLLNDKEPGDMKPIHRAYLHILRDPHVSAVISAMEEMEFVRQNVPLAGKAETLIG